MRKKREKKRSKVEIIFWIAIGFLFVGGIAFIGYDEINRIDTSLEKFPEYIAAGDYKSAVEVYNTHITDNETRKEKYDPLVEDTINEIVQSWTLGQTANEDAIKDLNDLSTVESPYLSESATKQMNYVKVESESEELYNMAEESFQSGDYLSALESLVKIDESYSQYESIEDFIEECDEILVELISYPASKKEYNECQERVKEYLNVQTCQAFIDKQEQLEKERHAFMSVSGIVENARTEFDKGEYKKAFEILEKAQNEGKKNRFIDETLEELHGSFVVSKAQEINKLVDKEEYTKALNLARDAQRIYKCEETDFIVAYVMENSNSVYGFINNLVEFVTNKLHSWKKEGFNVQHEADNAQAYIIMSGQKLLLGDYDKGNVTVLSMAGEIGTSIIGIDLPWDIRDLSYDIVHWGEDEYFEVRLAADMIALVPVIGAVKYLKYSEEAGKGAKAVSNLFGTSRVSKEVFRLLNNSSYFTNNSNQVGAIIRIVSHHRETVNPRLARYVGGYIEGTDIKVVRKAYVYSDGSRVIGNFPQFESSVDIPLPKERYQQTPKTQKKYCWGQLQDKAQNGTIDKDSFSKKEINALKNGDTLDGYAWHHSEEEGLMQLVDFDAHDSVNHKGGNKLWGYESKKKAADNKGKSEDEAIEKAS